jgi:hypothetical protein
VAVPQVIVDVAMAGPTPSDGLVIGDPARGLIGTAEVGGDDQWEDVTAWVRSWQSRRGATRGDGPTLRYEAGTCSIVLNNGDRRFDPTNLDGPYVVAGETQLTPMVRVRIRAVWDSLTYWIFSGFADNWALEYQENSWSTVTLTATDATKIFASYDRQASLAAGAGELPGPRIDRILDAAGWPEADRTIEAGETPLQATTLDGNVLTELQLVQDTELGHLYIGADGKVTFEGRHAFANSTSATPQGRFGDGEYVPSITYDLEGGVADFQGVDGTLAAEAVIVHSGSGSLKFTTVGSPVQAYVRPVTAATVEAGRTYLATMWVYYPAGGNVGAAIDWFDGSAAYLSTEYAGNAVAAATWTQIEVTGVAPPSAALGSIGPTLGSPSPGTVLYLDDLVIVDASSEIPYADVIVTTDDTGMANLVTIAREGGTAQTVEDTISRQRYLTKSHSRLDLLHTTDEGSVNYAETLLYLAARPEVRFATLTLRHPRPEVAADAWPQMLGRDIGHRITVLRRPPGGGDPIDLDSFVRGIEHGSDGADWKTVWTLQSATKYSFFVVGDPVLGVIGSNALAY